MASQNNTGRVPEVVSLVEGPELGQTTRPGVIGKTLNTDYPLIDNDPHISRVLRYARTSDYIAGGLALAFGPVSTLLFEYGAPTGLARRHINSMMRMSTLIGAAGGFILFYSRSINRFYGFSENRRELDMDMREMTDRVKRGLPIYGTSTMTEYMQGLASRQSRYSGVWIHMVPWFNFVNHPHHGVDTAKYYRQAELELEAERTGKPLS